MSTLQRSEKGIDATPWERPRIKSIADMMDELHRPTLLHLGSEQWKTIRANLEKHGRQIKGDIPKGQPVLEITPISDGARGALVRSRECRPGCRPTGRWECIHPDDGRCILVPGCICDPELPDGGGGLELPPQPSDCTVGLNCTRREQGPWNIEFFACEFICVDGDGNRCEDVHVEWLRQPDGVYALTCVH